MAIWINVVPVIAIVNDTLLQLGQDFCLLEE